MSYKGNRLIELKDHEGKITNLSYNGTGDVIQLMETTIESFTTKKKKIDFTYTPFGKLKSRKEDDRKIELEYNTEDQLIKITNEAKEEYRFERDSDGFVRYEIGYDDVAKQYTYSNAGKLTGIKRGYKADWTRMKYAQTGTLSEIKYGDDEEKSEYFTHGKIGELLTAKNSHSELVFEYDNLGNLIKEKQNGYTVESNYSKDHLGALTSLKTSLG
jgi:YD repeat-containing protein